MNGPRFPVGSRVLARFERNALNRYFRGTVDAARATSLGGGARGGQWGASLSVCIYNTLCCWVWCPIPHTYHIRYDDGRYEKGVSEQDVMFVAG